MPQRRQKLRIRLYGRLADAIGPEVDVDAPAEASVATVRELMVRSHPQAAHLLARSRACIGSELVADERMIAGSDELEFLPPVSGG